MDTVSSSQRHYNMSLIKSKDTKAEIMVRRYLFSKGLRFRKNDNKLPGHPDIVLPKYKTIVFINGCFWHGHAGCKYNRIPKTNTDYWKIKIESNRERDIRVSKELSNAGWNVITVWGCELEKSVADVSLEKLYRTIVGN